MIRRTFQIAGILMVAALMISIAGRSDEGTNEVRVRIGQPAITAGRACDPFWAEMTALGLVHTYEQTAIGWTELGIDWDAFQRSVLPEVGRRLAEGAGTFAGMVETILAGEQLLANAGVLDDWRERARQISPWPSFPPELPWPWPWPNCIWYAHALEAGGAVDRAVEAMKQAGSFQQMVSESPLQLAAILSEAILDTAALVASDAYSETMEQVAYQVAPIVLDRVSENASLRQRWVGLLDDWGADARKPEVSLAMAPFQDNLDEEGTEIRDWVDYVQAAAAVIGAAAAVAGLCF